MPLWQINEELNRRFQARLPLFDIAERARLHQAILDDFALEKDDASFPMKPQRVPAINGDAVFLMNAQDLETAVRRKLNVVAMVWLDGAYGLIKWQQQSHFQGRHSDLAFGNPDFEQFARSFGAWGRTLKAPDELTPAFAEAFAQPGPAVIAVPIDYGENLKLTQRLGNLAFTIQRRTDIDSESRSTAEYFSGRLQILACHWPIRGAAAP